MGLPKALKAHAEGKLVEAEAQYQRAFEQNVPNSVLYQNYGALLNKIGKTQQAEAVFIRGLDIHPNNPAILQNYANLLRKIKPATSLDLYLKLLPIICADEKKYSLKLYRQITSDVVDVLYYLGLRVWPYAVLREVIRSSGINVPILKNLILVHQDLAKNNNAHFLSELDASMLKQILSNDCTVTEQIALYFALAFHNHTQSDNDTALSFYNRAMDIFSNSYQLIDSDDQEEARSLVTENCWNFACVKLTLGDFDGWRLFDHGLRAPALGTQKWQRALVKPFTNQEIPLWRGESLINKNILLLDEQAVGDTMMFLTLIPSLVDKVSTIGLYLSKRLPPIYQRTFSDLIDQGKLKIFSKQDLISRELKFEDFHFQSAIGSICQYMGSTFRDLRAKPLQLLANKDLTLEIRRKYRSNPTKGFSEPPMLVGVSWRGGGRADRIKMKSPPLDLFQKLFQAKYNIRFVSLQYGDTASQCKSWSDSGFDIVHDPEINPLKDMDTWLAQVDACDAVISVANTTIHGAGGLNKPTYCLLSLKSDWRWFVDRNITRSYWYPSGGIARQSCDGGWQEATSLVCQWLASSCPMLMDVSSCKLSLVL